MSGRWLTNTCQLPDIYLANVRQMNDKLNIILVLLCYDVLIESAQGCLSLRLWLPTVCFLSPLSLFSLNQTFNSSNFLSLYLSFPLSFPQSNVNIFLLSLSFSISHAFIISISSFSSLGTLMVTYIFGHKPKTGLQVMFIACSVLGWGFCMQSVLGWGACSVPP